MGKLFAFAMKTTLAHIGEHLPTVSAVALCGGPGLYLLAFVAVRVRVTGTAGAELIDEASMSYSSVNPRMFPPTKRM